MLCKGDPTSSERQINPHSPALAMPMRRAHCPVGLHLTLEGWLERAASRWMGRVTPITCRSITSVFTTEVIPSVRNNVLLLLRCPQLKVTQEPRAKKGRRNQSVEPKKEVSCALGRVRWQETGNIFKVLVKAIAGMCARGMCGHHSSPVSQVWRWGRALLGFMFAHAVLSNTPVSPTF